MLDNSYFVRRLEVALVVSIKVTHGISGRLWDAQ